jgi:hypothetical protein
MKKNLRQIPFFLVLLPVFFVLHGFNENFDYINFVDCLVLIVLYSGSALLLFLLFLLLFKRPVQAALLTSYLAAFYLFFGALHAFLGEHSISHRYGLMLSGFVILGVLLLIGLKGIRSFYRLSFFLNLLFLLYLFMDIVSIAGKVFPSRHFHPPSYDAIRSEDKCDSCAKPDIYLLIFDEYSSSGVLKNIYHYDNSALDNFLDASEFSIQRRSRANYYMTPFSIASLLNLSYLKGIPDPDSLTLDDYKKINLSIKNAEAIRFLVSRGYRIVNYSPFDLQDHPSIQHQPFIVSDTRFITDQTLPYFFQNELNWVIGKWLSERHLIDSSLIAQSYFSQIRDNNARMLAMAKEESLRKVAQPRFVYVHLFLPHEPYLYDSLGRWKNMNEVAMNGSTLREYLGYLPFTNACARNLVTAIKNNTGGKAVILFMSDHGFKFNPDGIIPAHSFYNQNAVYFPDKDYRLFYDSISIVNQFRVVFKKLFHQNLPLLKDTVIFLHDKQ